jgi:hypothetical protein
MIMLRWDGDPQSQRSIQPTKPPHSEPPLDMGPVMDDEEYGYHDARPPSPGPLYEDSPHTASTSYSVFQVPQYMPPERIPVVQRASAVPVNTASAPPASLALPASLNPPALPAHPSLPSAPVFSEVTSIAALSDMTRTLLASYDTMLQSYSEHLRAQAEAARNTHARMIAEEARVLERERAELRREEDQRRHSQELELRERAHRQDMERHDRRMAQAREFMDSNDPKRRQIGLAYFASYLGGHESLV